MDEIIKFLNGFNIQTTVSMAVIVWYFTKEASTETREMKRELGEKIDRIEKDLHEMNTRISRVEGTVYGHEVYKKID